MIGCGRRKVLVTENLLSEFYDCHEQGEVGSGVKRDLDLEREEDSEEKSTAQMRLFFLSHWPYLVFISLAHIYLEFVTETAGKRFRMCILIQNAELIFALTVCSNRWC